MKFRSLILTATLTACAFPAFAQNSTTTTPTTTTTVQPEANNPLDEWKAFNQPSKEHVMLAKNMAGNWNATTKFWMAPNTEAVTSTGTAQFSPVMGARFIMQEQTGEFAGQKFKGLGFFGYNNGAKCFESFWIDNESTLMLMSTGTQQADGSIEWKGTYTDPMSGEKRTSRSVTRFPAENTFVYEMYEKGSDGTEFKSLEVTYTRIANEKTNTIKTNTGPVTDPHTPATNK